MTTPESVYETWRFCEEWWVHAVQHGYFITPQELADNASVAIFARDGKEVDADTAAALIRDAVVRRLHEMGYNIASYRFTDDDRSRELTTYYIVGNDGTPRGGGCATYDDALAAAAKMVVGVVE